MFVCMRQNISPRIRWINIYNDLFRWTWIFHNAVNKRLKKEELDKKTAYNLYANAETGICRFDCGADATSSQGSQGSQPIGVSAGKADPKSLLTTVLPPPMPKIPKGSSDQVRYVPTSARTNQRLSAGALAPIQSGAQLTVGQSPTQLTVVRKAIIPSAT